MAKVGRPRTVDPPAMEFVGGTDDVIAALNAGLPHNMP